MVGVNMLETATLPSLSIMEKIQLGDEKNLLIQGLPSSIEKQFSKLSFAKNLTPLLKSRGIEFALVFSINQKQLTGILREVLPALAEDAKLWIAYPKAASKIVTDLNRECTWDFLTDEGYETVSHITLDHVWSALRFKKSELFKNRHNMPSLEGSGIFDGINVQERLVQPPADLEKLLKNNKKARDNFEGLPMTNRKEFVVWINSARKEDTRLRRLETSIEKLEAGKRNPSDK